MCQCRNDPNNPKWSECCGEPYCPVCDWHLSECQCDQSPLEEVQAQDGYYQQEEGNSLFSQALLMGVIVLAISALISLALILVMTGILSVLFLVAFTVFLFGKMGAIFFWVGVLFLLSGYLAYRYVRRMPIM